MTASLAAARAEPVADRSVFTALATCGLRRFAVNPVFLAGAALTAFTAWAACRTAVTEIDTVTPYPAIYLGGFGMMAAFWQTRSMRASEPIVGTTRRRCRCALPHSARSRSCHSCAVPPA